MTPFRKDQHAAMPKKSQLVYRFALLKGATQQERRDYQKKVKALVAKKRWNVIADWTKPSEIKAVLVVRRGPENTANHGSRPDLIEAWSRVIRALGGSYD